MKKRQNNVIIIGGGLIGLIAGYMLSKKKIPTAVFDSGQITDKKTINLDIRTTAIAEESKIFLEKIGIWKPISKYAQKIEKIHVIDRKKSNLIKFINPNKNQNLGYIVSNALIKKILLKKITNNRYVKIYENSNISKINFDKESASLFSNSCTYKTKFIIAADGKNSFVRKYLKVPVYSKKYDQKALVLNIEHSKKHNNTAYEIFLSSGPLASLPMISNIKRKNYSSLVWSHSPEYIDSINMMNNSDLKVLINEISGEILGRINKIFYKKTFPLSAHINNYFYHDKLIFVGDSAHSIHPIAGQGWNLGVRDLQILDQLIDSSINNSEELGTLNFCKQYHDLRFYDAFNLYQVTDKLNRIFLRDGVVSNKIRNIGFSLINSNKKINKFISNYAMGRRL